MGYADIVIKWQDRSSREWMEFDTPSLRCSSVESVCLLFSGDSIPVVARDGSLYIVNSEDLAERYRRNGKRVLTFDELMSRGSAGLQRTLGDVGFFGCL